jgi:hypothetical protein
VLRVSLIDPFVGFDALRLEDDEWLYSKVPDARVDDDRDRAFCRWLTWHGTRRQIWTARSFTADLRRRGWVDIRHTLYRSTMLVGLDTLDSRADESFFVEAIPSQLCDAE